MTLLSTKPLVANSRPEHSKFSMGGGRHNGVCLPYKVLGTFHVPYKVLGTFHVPF